VNTLFLPAAIHREILAYARNAYPDEAVGLLGGRERHHAECILPLPNIAGTGRFFADPYAQFQAEKQLKAQQKGIVAIYHSHPDAPAQLSDIDIEVGRLWPCAQLVISISGSGATPEIAAYELGRASFVPLKILLLPQQ
jgi:[CysO sulfur-carrier protein]-S-L-cysteine hydrolase